MRLGVAGKMLGVWFCVIGWMGCEAADSIENEGMEPTELDERVVSTGHTFDNLSPGGALTLNQYLQSADGSRRFYLQSDGNLVLRRMSDKKALWSSRTDGKSATHFAFQRDGNLVLYTASNAAVWASNTVGSGATKLRLHSAGQLVLYKDSTAVWSVGDAPVATDQCPDDPNKTDPGLCGCGVPEGTCSGVAADASTLKGKVMAGYQGWFGTSCDGSGKGWRHWARSTPNAGNITFDMWPDLREYASSELCATGFKYSNGQNAGLFSAYNSATVDRHVKWMKDYGIDGVFVQRFVSEAVKMTAVRDKVLKNVRIASEKYGRVFVNMYDISGTSASTLVSDIKKDWMHLVDDLKVTASPRYLRHNGRPLLAIWGFGFGDRPGTPSQAAELITWLTQTAPSQYRVTLMGGVSNQWRSHSSEWLNVYRKFHVISPWAVGRYADDAGADNYKTNVLGPDLSDCKSRGIGYMPVIYPGFSWYNLKTGTSPLNRIPRRGGKFFWRQAYNAVSAGAEMIYVAMYDEVDEGTAMFKIAEKSSQLPTTGKFVPLNAEGTALPSDWYLKLMGQATKMLRGQIALTSTIPITP